MRYAIFDTGAGFLQWLGEAANAQAAIKSLQSESSAYDHDDQDPVEPFITVYQLTDAEVTRIHALEAKGEHVYQDFEDEGQEFNLTQMRQIVRS